MTSKPFSRRRLCSCLSRRQLDKRYGRLAEEGFTSYEAKAKARASTGLSGFRRAKSAGVFERTVDNARERKAVLRGFPGDARVTILVQGDDPKESYGQKCRNVWRAMNFAPRRGRARPMRADELLDVWDRSATRAGGVIRRPRGWVIRVYW